MNKRLKKKLGFESIRVARVLPGDMVVVKANIILSDEDKAITCRQLAGLFPKNKVLVMDATCDMEIKRIDSKIGE